MERGNGETGFVVEGGIGDGGEETWWWVLVLKGEGSCARGAD